ncbi:PREDICTED: uncharacterized protein LOC108546855 [Eufriesea mexicana]|uniref:uncharacterized protein LOC108546855 n=1 Tax=Eufriesea mexicana TaxID=516756 RepID=UPI00083C6853|nr:PREDICTED: uncharacterized protein LOC108546855 [Eufriesea mexicana]XP_017754621.1 PREDICTED: uncharacterized protein LOC108546855 [Eufriesea mexicana]XP_017754622.1 PREDICTED: uncharacterized protein LOC108546855 [Eufriesea mexicana]
MLKDVSVKLCILLLLYEHATGFVIPEELPTILSLIYSNIPPIKKGTDSRIGVGFRLGEHADFQVLLELGPQTDTDPIGNAESKRRRDAMLSAAMRGELGPLAQAVARYQMERKLQKELERLEKTGEKLKTVAKPANDDKKTVASEWLTKWSEEMVNSTEDRGALEDVSGEKNATEWKDNGIIQRIGRPPKTNGGKNTVSDLKELYKSKGNVKNE